MKTKDSGQELMDRRLSVRKTNVFWGIAGEYGDYACESVMKCSRTLSWGFLFLFLCPFFSLFRSGRYMYGGEALYFKLCCSCSGANTVVRVL